MEDDRIPRSAFKYASCTLRVHDNCSECQMKITEVISSMVGVCDVNIDAEKRNITISGEVDRKLFHGVIGRLGKLTGGEHAGLVRHGVSIYKMNSLSNNNEYPSSIGNNHINGGGALIEGGGNTVYHPSGRWQMVEEHPNGPTQWRVYPSGRRQAVEHPTTNCQVSPSTSSTSSTSSTLEEEEEGCNQWPVDPSPLWKEEGGTQKAARSRSFSFSCFRCFA